MSLADWRLIPGLDGLYEANSAGDVRSVDRVTTYVGRWGAVTKRRHAGTMLRPRASRQGYLYVNPCIDGVRTSVAVHRAVALAFLGAPPDWCTDVNHIDGVKSNNAAANLEWCTRKQNMQHALAAGLIPKGRRVVATPKNGGDPILFECRAAAAAALGDPAKSGNIGSALHGLIPSAYGYRWRYADEAEIPDAVQAA